MRPDATTGPPDRGKSAVTVTELGHLASGVGHHVINAFAAVVSNAEILRLKLTGPDPIDPTALSDAIIRTAVEAAGVARRLIDVTRPLTGVGQETVHIDRLIADYTEARAAEGGAARWSSSPVPVPPILGNEDMLRAMLDHITSNCLDATEGGEVDIHLSTALDGRGWVVLDVRDTGGGMPIEVLERAVEPFFTTKPGRLGVGLSIANGIWRRHKGTLAVRSQVGEGTLVHLCVEPIRAPA